ncbi:MAG: phosphodiesterase [Gammaproteobacteria bacterium]|nr:phosphodiesterase [Gammaproteobacteria bacterium]
MKYLIALFASIGLLFSVNLVQADTLKIPVGAQAGASSLSLPSRGTSTQHVLQRHGEPQTRHPAVGQPPITRWDYADFSVYFEHNHVVHSVRHHRPTQSAE